MRRSLPVLLTAAVLALTGSLAGCGGAATDDSARGPEAAASSSSASPTASESATAAEEPGGHEMSGHDMSAKPPKPAPLRDGESRETLTMPAAYTPSAPTGVGTDDYRCFLLDPKLDQDAWLTGTNVLPGNPGVVHHVILFRVPPEQVAEAEAKDAETSAEGWTCFGGSGLDGEFQSLDDAAWLGAWAPGGKESLAQKGYGVRLAAGSRVIMQVHYNLLAGASPDTSSTQLRTMPGSTRLTPLHTYLMPAPVELPCRADHDSSPLCDRDAAVEDAKARFGIGPGQTANALHVLCGGEPPGEWTSCTRTVNRPMTILGAAGHMHLLGRQIRIETNPGTPRARTVLDIPLWNFDDQGSKPVDPVTVRPGDTIEVSCQHVQWLRDELPAFDGQEEKYVIWGEGTTDEMCLGMLQVAFD